MKKTREVEMGQTKYDPRTVLEGFKNFVGGAGAITLDTLSININSIVNYSRNINQGDELYQTSEGRQLKRHFKSKISRCNIPRVFYK